MSEKNARIDSTFLGVEDHGLFIAQITMDYGDSMQSFQRIVGSKSKAESIEVLWRICDVVGVSSWESLKGKYCRVRIHDGLIRQIGHIVKDEWTILPGQDD